jgi:predicted PurR-regulated permease PerM
MKKNNMRSNSSSGENTPDFRLFRASFWQKAIIWGLFLLSVYLLRDFFFVIFMTFMTTYLVRAVLGKIRKLLWPDRDLIWAERSASAGIFVLILASLYLGGSYIGPALYDQGRALLQQSRNVQPERVLNGILTKTVGAYLFQRSYGFPGDARYEAGFADFANQGPGAVEFMTFPQTAAALTDRFELEEAERIKARLTEKDFETWFLANKVPAIFEQSRDAYIADWESHYKESAVGLPSRAIARKSPDFERLRDQSIAQMILRTLDSSAEEKAVYQAEWQAEAVKHGLEALRATPEYEQRFKSFYQSLQATGADKSLQPPPYDYAKFVELTKAHAQGEETFKAALNGLQTGIDSDNLPKAHAAFEEKETAKLMTSFLASPEYVQIHDAAIGYVKQGLMAAGTWVPKALWYMGKLPVQLALSLLLSFFIVWDFEKLRRSIAQLRYSRIRNFYAEIEPGIYNFGSLIGRTISAQAVIALFNTALTFFAIRVLGIQNEIMLCVIVFLCSLIPVLGVVLSSVPIAVMAIIQPEGSIILALKAIAAIIVIHFIETSIINPRVLGNMLDINPVMVLAVLTVGEHFFQVWGLLLAVPVSVFFVRCVIFDEGSSGLMAHDRLNSSWSSAE